MELVKLPFKYQLVNQLDRLVHLLQVWPLGSNSFKQANIDSHTSL